MKKIWTSMFFVLTFAVLTASLSGADSLPANRNLLNPSRLDSTMEQTGDGYEASVKTNLPIHIESGSTYTFSVPTSIGSDVAIKLHGGEHAVTYIDETTGDTDGVCTESNHAFFECTFTATKDDLHIELHGTKNLAMHLHHLQYDGFQLEEGDVRSDYIAYEPLVVTPPEFVGESTLHVSYTKAIPIMQILEENIVVHDEIDGTIPTEDIVIREDHYTGHETTAGIHLVVLEASDSAGNTSTFDLQIHVFDLIDPIITGPDVVKVDVDEGLAVHEVIEGHFTFHDDHDGVLEAYEIITDTYSDDPDILGEKNVSFEVSDASGNKASHTLTIVVEDYDAPLIIGETSHTVLQSNMQSLESILAMYQATDNHTPSYEIEMGINTHGYDPEASSGTYQVDIYAKDASGNQALKTVTITVLDDIAPVIYAESFLRQSYKDAFDLEAYMGSMTVTDNDDEAISNDSITLLYDDYVESVPGSYTFEFSLKDASGNEATHALKLEVIDDVGPVFETVASVHVDTEAPLSQDNLQALLMQDESLQAFTPVSYEVITDSYSGNSKEEGDYLYTVKYTNADGESMVRSLDLRVATIEEPDAFNVFPLVGGFGLIALTTLVVWRIKRR